VTTPLANLPTDELVACEWISTIPGFTAAIVATLGEQGRHPG
jgi:hypothetical protein